MQSGTKLAEVHTIYSVIQNKLDTFLKVTFLTSGENIMNLFEEIYTKCESGIKIDVVIIKWESLVKNHLTHM